jgi:hypothetical protein
VFTFASDYFRSRNIFDPSNQKHLSVLFLVSGYNMVNHHISIKPYTGLGPGKFFDVYDSYEGSKIPDGLKSKDGPFGLAKLIIEYGLPITLLILLPVVHKLLSTHSWALFYIFSNYMLLRGWGFSPIIVASILLLCNKCIPVSVRRISPLS